MNNPCLKCKMSAAEKAACCGCPERLEYEKHETEKEKIIMPNKVSEDKQKPLGITARWVHDSNRAKEILDAIERYTEANMSIPKSWIEELQNLFKVYFK